MDSPGISDTESEAPVDVAAAPCDGSASMPLRHIGCDEAASIENCLADLVADLDLEFAALLDDAGTVLGWSSDAEPGVAAALEPVIEAGGALAMGTFAAARMLATQLGGERSRELIHHAGERGFYLTEPRPGLALFCSWTGGLAPGLLRDRATLASRALASRALDGLVVVSEPVDGGDYEPLLPDDVEFSNGGDWSINAGEGRPPRPETDGSALVSPGFVHQESKAAQRYVFEIG